MNRCHLSRLFDRLLRRTSGPTPLPACPRPVAVSACPWVTAIRPISLP